MKNLYKVWLEDDVYFIFAINQYKAIKKTLKYLDKEEDFYTNIGVDFIGIDEDFININI